RYTAGAALLGVVLSAQGPAQPPLVRSLAALMQATRVLEELVAAGELSAVHNEDSTLSAAVRGLRDETKLGSPVARDDLARTLTAFGEQVGELHEAADAFRAKDAKAQLRKLLALSTHLKTFYGEEVLAPAQTLADVYACPMHHDVVGKRVDTC